MGEQGTRATPTRNEVGATAQLLAHAVDVLSRPVQGTHRTIANTVFAAVGPFGLPAWLMHNSIAALTYAGVRAGARATAGIVTAVSDQLPAERVSHVVTGTAAGSVLVGAVNGLLGDQLLADGNHLAVELGPHHQRKVVGLDTALLTASYTTATGHLAVFVHGLGETEQAWWYRNQGRGSHGEHLAELGVTPVVMRYNTGRSIAENGARLAGLLGELLQAWPVPVERIDLVGHSMGGLVLREACHHDDAQTWLERVRTVCYLGTPHEGAPLADGAHRLARALSWWWGSRSWGELIDVRSIGIDDLRRANRLPLVPGVRHVGVTATLAADPQTWWAAAVGDGLVPLHSARGPLDELHVLPSTGHLALLTAPEVSEVLAELVVWDSDPDEVDRHTEAEQV
ncbi:alpha/beta hydrolase [Rhodococcus sp. X156]|uniref:PGAP1-like alpha/beta domain-containing protein n=1 Tax=Rhodococcus sp. X156 TaxID=2499145 RepID=UPI000FD889AA|nr:alpha/beta hydrolase [Rhodococcus sp. X156]